MEIFCSGGPICGCIEPVLKSAGYARDSMTQLLVSGFTLPGPTGKPQDLSCKIGLDASGENKYAIRGTLPSCICSIPSILNQKEEEEGKNQNGTTTSSSKDSFLALLKHLIQVADALSRLESECQSESTQGWINGAKTVESTLNKGDVGSNSIIQGDIASPLTLSFSQAEQDECVELGIEVPLHMSVGDYVVSSVTYLHAKIEQCQTDVANFQLSHVLAIGSSNTCIWH